MPTAFQRADIMPLKYHIVQGSAMIARESIKLKLHFVCLPENFFENVQDK